MLSSRCFSVFLRRSIRVGVGKQPPNAQTLPHEMPRIEIGLPFDFLQGLLSGANLQLIDL